MEEREAELGFRPQRENAYNRFLPEKETQDKDSKAYLEEVKTNLLQAIRDNDIAEGAHKWVVNLHKYMILYGLKFIKEDHVLFIRLLYGLLTTKHVDTVILDAVAKVLHALLKKKFLLTRKDLTLPWEPLFQLYWFWEDSSLALRGLLKAAQGFKSQIKTVIKFSRGFFSDDATQEMLDKWRHMLCPHDRSMSTGMKYFSLFLPTSRDIPPEKSWRLWFPEFSMLWATWSNSPAWEVDLLKLYNRLAFHQVGEVDWEPMMGDLYTRFMVSFKLPVTYGNSGVRNKHGLASNSSLGSITQWMVATLGPGSSGQQHLSRLLVALQSYYHPANMNSSSEYLHAFVSFLCNQFVNRVHVERYNRKWECRVPREKRLRDEDITAFVRAVKPVAFHVLYSTYEEEARTVFNSLSLLAPEMILPELLDRLATASESLTEPHRFHVCIQALSAAAGPLMRTYPERAIDLLNLLLPGIDVNDIWKCTDIFILMSDLLEMMPVADLTKQQQYRHTNSNLSEEERERLHKTADLENFVVEFMNRCFTLIENTRRENVRADAGNSDDYLNDEELAADAAVNDTFLRIVANASDEMFTIIFDKLQKYLRGKIVEPNVAGGILASMCKSVVQARPAAGLAFFVPYLSESITRLIQEREGRVSLHKTDEELQFNLQLLAEVLSVRNAQLYRSRGSHLVPYIEQICTVLDLSLHLAQKDEYELSHSMLQSLLTWLCHIRIVECDGGPRQQPTLSGWGATVPLDSLLAGLQWYRPADQELGVVRGLMERYLVPLLTSLDRYAKGEQEMDKDTLNRNLKLVWRIVVGISELLPPDQASEWESVLPRGMAWLDRLRLTLPGGEKSEEIPVRKAVRELLGRVQARILGVANDDTESLCSLLNVHDVLIFCYGMDEDEIGDRIEDQKREKAHREDRLVKNKQHLPSVHYERISIQWETHVWLKNILVMESLPRQAFEDIFSLCVHQYSEVRVLAQEILLKIIARIGKASHSLIVPKLVKCLEHAPGVISNEMFKAALYIINSEKFMFFYSWEAAAQLWPPLVSAQHGDKQSLDDLLRDIGVKMNRHFQDFALYTLPLSTPEPPHSLMQLVRSLPANQNLSPHAAPSNRSLERLSLGPHIHYQALATSIARLVAAKTLHWRHHEMAVGMLLSMLTYDCTPDREMTSLWLQLLLDDQRTIRMMAHQALEGILKLEKIKSRKVPLESLLLERLGGPPPPPLYPGLREDNEFLQYKSEMEQGELEVYWNQPFLVKSSVGYWGWPAGHRARLPHTQEDFKHPPGSVRDLITQFFLNEALVTRFVELNSLEHEKGEDFFSCDRGLFLSFLLENIGPALATTFQSHIERLVSSPEESQQRAAAEMVYGLVRGIRFWDFQSALQTWSWLLPVFQQVLTSVTAETQRDWDFCFSGASDKADSNRLRPLYELLIMPENLVSQGAFKESSYLLFVTKCLSQNWRVRELYCRTYNILRSHWDHPYNNVRHQIANTLATLLSMDIPIMRGAMLATKNGDSSEEGGDVTEWNVGRGFPTIRSFVDEMLPRLSLNIHNPEFCLSSSQSGSQEDISTDVVVASPGVFDAANDVSVREETIEDAEEEDDERNTSSEDVSMVSSSAMDTEDGGGGRAAALARAEGEETKRANRILETVSLWICHQIRLSSVTVSTELFRLMPYLCQFIGNERDQDVAQACLQALCYLSVCVLPDHAIPVMLDITKRIAMSPSYKTKMSMLEYLQVSVFTNFPKIVVNATYRHQIQALVVSLLKDESLPVRQKAAKILGGLVHSGFLEEAEVTSLLADLRSRVRPKMTRAGRRFRKESTSTTTSSHITAPPLSTAAAPATAAGGAEPVDNAKDQALLRHSGVLGLCAFVEAFPYEVPPFVPPILMELSTHLNDPQPIPTTIKKALQEFKRTHQDNWQEHKTKFTEDQLVVMTDLLVSQNYYA